MVTNDNSRDQRKKGARPFRVSPVAVAVGRTNLMRFNASRHLLPKCGAKRRTSGQPCNNIPMANGRCRLHGGLVPKGKDWHQPQPPKDGPRAADKLAGKLRNLALRAKRRAARLAKMTAEERLAHEEWQRSHRPGSAAARARAKAERQAAAEVAELVRSTCDAPRSAELVALDRRLDEAKRRLRELETEASGERIFG